MLTELKKVKFEAKTSEEQTKTQQGMDRGEQPQDNTTGPTSHKQLMKQNILHPTTKTLTPIQPHTNKAPTPRETTKPSMSLPEKLLNPPAISNTPPRNISHHHAIPNKPSKPPNQNTSNPSELKTPTLTPIESLRAMVQKVSNSTNKPPATNQNQPTNLPLRPDNKPNIPEVETNIGGGKGARKWRRATLVTPKVEGESVKMGKRATDSGSIMPNFDDSTKKSKRGPHSTTAATAAADKQPRRSS